jgi:hypothetical protein
MGNACASSVAADLRAAWREASLHSRFAQRSDYRSGEADVSFERKRRVVVEEIS